MKTIIWVCWLWMSQAALLCLLYLVLLTATNIHHYLVADAPNHSILPLIYLTTTPLENPSVHPGMYCVDPPIHLNVQSSIHPWVHLSTHSTCHSSVCPFMLSFIHSSLHPLSIHPSIHSSSSSFVCWRSSHLSIHPVWVNRTSSASVSCSRQKSTSHFLALCSTKPADLRWQFHTCISDINI